MLADAVSESRSNLGLPNTLDSAGKRMATSEYTCPRCILIEIRRRLNEAGRRKLYQIVTASPPAYRTVYVVRSMNPDAHERRLSSIKQAYTDLFGNEAYSRNGPSGHFASLLVRGLHRQHPT